MNVQGVIRSYVVKTYDAKTTKASKTPESEGARPTREKVEISKSSDEIQTIRQFLDALPDVRLQAVEEIQEKIKNNDYPFENKLEPLIEKMLEQGIPQDL